jgi:hypothetical protein
MRDPPHGKTIDREMLSKIRPRGNIDVREQRWEVLDAAVGGIYCDKLRLSLSPLPSKQPLVCDTDNS